MGCCGSCGGEEKDKEQDKGGQQEEDKGNQQEQDKA